MPETKVINIHKCPLGWEKDPQFQYIGRHWSNAPKGGGKWGTRYREQEFPGGKACQLYEADLIDRLQNDNRYYKDLKALAGKSLVCYCTDFTLCHGAVLARWAEKLSAPEDMRDGPIVHLEASVVRNAQQGMVALRDFRSVESEYKDRYDQRVERARREATEMLEYVIDAHSMVLALRSLVSIAPYHPYEAFREFTAEKDVRDGT